MRYLLLIYTEPPAMAPSDEAVGEELARYGAYSAWLRETGQFLGGEALKPVTDATTVQLVDGRRVVTDGPFAETKEHLGGLLPDRGESTLMRRSRPPRDCRPPPTARSRSGRSGRRRDRCDRRSSRRRRPRPGGGRRGVSRGPRPRARHPDPRPGRLRSRRGGRRRRVPGGAGALAGRRDPRQPGRVDHDDGTQPRDRPCATGEAVRGQGPGPGARRGRRRGPRGQRPAHGGGGRDASDPRRPAPTHLHLLSPGPGAGGGGGADAAHAGRPDHARDRPRLPRPGADPRPAPGAREAEDPRGRDPLRGPDGRPPGRPAGRGPAGALPGVQRGLRRVRRRGADPARAVRGGDPAWPASSPTCCPTSRRRWGSSR